MCPSCYKSNLQILKKVPPSTDDDFFALLTNLKHLIIPSEDVTCIEYIINRAIYITDLYVGERFIQQKALLLPAVYGIFTDFLSQFESKANVESEISEKCLMALK